MTIWYWDSTASKWAKFMQANVMPADKDDFIRANTPDGCTAVDLPDGHPAKFHPSDWAYDPATKQVSEINKKDTAT